MKIIVSCSSIQKCKVFVLFLVKRRDLNTTDSIVVESCIMKLQLRSKPAHHMLSMESKYQRM